jgi:phosphotransferase system enzyme I (PtsI)
MSTIPTGRFPSESLTGATVLTGTPVVPGVALGPVVRPIGAIELPATKGPWIPEDQRAAQKTRFSAAAEAVAERLAARAAAATGVSAEVLNTTAQLARDRGLLSTVEQRIGDGATAEVATVGAA